MILREAPFICKLLIDWISRGWLCVMWCTVCLWLCVCVPPLCVSRWGFLMRTSRPVSLIPASLVLQQTAALHGPYWSDHLCVCLESRSTDLAERLCICVINYGWPWTFDYRKCPRARDKAVRDWSITEWHAVLSQRSGALLLDPFSSAAVLMLSEPLLFHS